MKKNKNIAWVVSLLMLAFLASCADESPVNSLEEEIADDKYDVQTEINSDKNNYYSSSSYYYGNSYSSSYVSESEKCRLGTSSYSDSYCCSNFGYQCSYSSSSSKKYSSSSYYYGNSYSSSSVSESEKCRLGTSSKSDSYCCSYYGYQCGLDESKTMLFTLTYYEQKTSGWDGLQNAGDPEIYFNIYTYSEGISAQTLNTGVMLNRSDLTYWSGSISTELTLIQGVDSIRVCPHITDEDVSAHDDYSSGYCYSIKEIGSLEDYEVVEQSDYYNSDASVKWEWYLY